MARSLILSPPTPAPNPSLSFLFSLPRFSKTKFNSIFSSNTRTRSFSLSPIRFLCNLSLSKPLQPINISKHKETFASRMAMSGLKPHDRIAIGVSGGPDSMALCVLAANWKTECIGFVDGLLGIVVDHGLRAESGEEAILVSHRVSEMGIKCEVAKCEWPDGKPKWGRLQEAAREMRYQILQKVCNQHSISSLLIAHHADDQAELFILRLSRSSGVLGLAGMAFTSQLFSSHAHSFGDTPDDQGILLVRPLLDFSKDDLYEICVWAGLEWVEDPTNKSTIFSRNRIRLSLGNLSCSLKAELQAVIAACRKTRLYVDHTCNALIARAVTIMAQGYAVINLEVLDPSNIEDISLSKFIALVLQVLPLLAIFIAVSKLFFIMCRIVVVFKCLSRVFLIDWQFISQRHRPVRGGTLKLLLEYFRTFPCKNSLTAAGCYLCPAPGSKGSNILVCCSVNCPLPSKMDFFKKISYEGEKHLIQSEVEHITVDIKSYSHAFVPDSSDVHFLDLTPSESVLDEAKRVGILSESSFRSILLLQREEMEHFRLKTESGEELKHGVKFASTLSDSLLPWQIGYFMNRFLMKWEPFKRISENAFATETASLSTRNVEEDSQNSCCGFCEGCDHTVAIVRCMIDADWINLVKLSNCQKFEDFQDEFVLSPHEMKHVEGKTRLFDYLRSSARGAVIYLKSIPVSARRALPVLVNPQGHLLSIPSIGFNVCPCLMVSAVFKPRVPLGGGHSSFI
ncbi:tRNA(Ile)-lysidine/2-thiocytidine synthase, N-terminal [Dillenia turbinata]|uniref:tRNA(Ile)-lysidine synthetase n=1 Tax=Dillenia turbinata TaxID=194707 RepID=A0AAN8ZTS2_9MAGN